ncbi:MAG TPA: 6-phosphofructokinase [Firmicutes bacterium]|jgi:6-phosphofructokinase 1|nr:6-phosphofructokinase [Bacillota bacterium]
MVQRIGVLTSGGDSPGMNAAIRAIVRAGLKNGKDMFVIYNGYKGLVEGQIEQVDRSFVSSIINLGGTILRSARLPEFADPAVRQRGVEQLRRHGIDALVVIGGDGTYMGAKKLSEMGINCIGLPGTIDNDIACTDYTIGFDTCLNTIINAVDKLRDTTSSHQRCSIIEVMGNRSGDLALFSGIACGVELIVSSDHLIPKKDIMDAMLAQKKSAKQHAMIIVSEKLFDVQELAREIEREVGFESRAEVLGRIQRGGSPSAFDRILASRMGAYAIDCLVQGKSGRCIAIVGNEMVDYDIYEALAMQRNPHTHLVRVIDNLK